MKFGSQYGCGVQSVSVRWTSYVAFDTLTKLPDVHDVVLILQHSSLVVIHIQIIWCAEDGHHARETGGPSLPVHAVTGILGFVCANDGKQIVLFEESTGGRVREEIRAAPDVVVDEEIVSLLLSKLFERVSP
jgi:hypothetical protein